jgi:hypothetical protein
MMQSGRTSNEESQGFIVNPTVEGWGSTSC